MTTEINLLTFVSLTVHTHVGAPVQPHPGVGTQPATGSTTAASTQPHPGAGITPVATGQVVVIVQRQVGEGGYDILGVGKVVQSTTAHSSDLIPVLVAFTEPKASEMFSVGQVVLWPKALLAIYGERIQKEPAATSVEPPSPISSIPTNCTEDRRMNYGRQVMQLGVFLMQLNDTEAEGDGERSIRNWKVLMLYFRARPRSMKYAFEAMRFLTFTKALYSERMAHRVLHGQFVNPKGENGNNYANDLKMEHEVRNDKAVLKGMCGNKTLKAVQRSTSCSYMLSETKRQYDRESNIPPSQQATLMHAHLMTSKK